MCTNPKWIYKKGRYKQANYRNLGQLDTNYEIGTYSKCGRCEQCINSKCNDWVVRNFYEQKAHGENICFITLTYEKNPILIHKEDMQKFWKRLRIILDKEEIKIRKFEAMEYGELNGRPHAHAIIYGWTEKEENLEYIGINKKGNILYQSKTIQQVWGMGRTSYQKFEPHEIPYLTLYETPQETFKKAYILTREKAKKIKELYLKTNFDENRQKELLKNLNELLDEMNEKKYQYMAVKEWQSWSIALGWEEYEKEYLKEDKHVFECYIEDKIFQIPTSWVKKLANMGYQDAIEEMYRREKFNESQPTESQERRKNELLLSYNKKQKIFDWKDKKTRIEDLY